MCSSLARIFLRLVIIFIIFFDKFLLIISPVSAKVWISQICTEAFIKDKLTVFTKGLLDFMFFSGILTTVLVPIIIRFYSFLIALITCCRLFVYVTPAVLVVILIFVIAGLFSKVLSRVFDQAVTYKEENDLTI